MNQTIIAEASTETSAEVYDRLFLPTLIGPWAVRVADAARISAGDRVLDVACGTGGLTSEALRRVGTQGTVAGLDSSTDMLSVARRKLPALDWREGRAEALPFEDGAFDVVLCQFGLMYFNDREQAVREMRRVLRPGGRVALAVWDRLERTPAYTVLTELVEQRLGPDAGKPIRDAFAIGDVALIRSLLDGAGFDSIEAASINDSAHFPSLQNWIDAEVKGWVGGGFDDNAYAAFSNEAKQVLGDYEQADGSAEFELPAIVATGVKA